ncbi:MAG: type II secretion system protein [Planctomycetota bacterium]
MPRISRRNGFTLIELLVVISIIGLLISILLPALGAARHTARLSQDLSQQRQLMIGTAAYQVDYDGFFPLSARLNNTFNVSFDELLIPYVQGVSYSFDDAWADQYITRNEINMEIWQSPVDTLEPAFTLVGGEQKRSYAISRGPLASNLNNPNAWDSQRQTGVSRTAAIDANYNWTDQQGNSMRIDEVLNASGTISIAPQFRDTSYCGWSNLDSVALYELINSNRGYYGFGWGSGDYNCVYGYDNGGGSGQDPADHAVNFTFADGHSEAIKLQDTVNELFPTTNRADGTSPWNARK